MPSAHKPPGSAAMYAGAIGPNGLNDHRPATEPVSRPNSERQAANFNRLLEEPVVAKGAEVHTEWRGPNKGDDQDRSFLSTDPRLSNHGGQLQPTRQVSKARLNFTHPRVARHTRSASHTPRTSLRPSTDQRETPSSVQAADQWQATTDNNTLPLDTHQEGNPMPERARDATTSTS